MVVVVTSWLLLVAAAGGPADNRPGVWIRWERGADALGCIPQDRLVRAVQAREPDARIVTQGEATVRLYGQIEADATLGGWRASFTLFDRAGEEAGIRELAVAHPDCSTLDESLALVVSLMIHEQTLAPPPVEEPEEPQAPEAPHALELRSGLVLADGLMPDFAYGVEVAATHQPPWPLPLELRLRFWPEREHDIQAGSGEGSATFLALTGGVAACPALLRYEERLRVDACAGVDLGWLRAEGLQFAQPARADRLVGMATVGARIQVRLYGALFLGAGATAAFPFLRDDFFLAAAAGQRQRVHRLDTVLPLGSFWLGTRLGDHESP